MPHAAWQSGPWICIDEKCSRIMVKSRIEFIFSYYIEEGNGHLLADGWKLKTAIDESKSIHMSERYYYPCPTSICLCYISPQFLLLREDFVLILWLLYCLFQSLKTHLFLTHRWIEREGRGRKGNYMCTWRLCIL